MRSWSCVQFDLHNFTSTAPVGLERTTDLDLVLNDHTPQILFVRL
jgi:hypothetical protein